jgi:hypothetical protein
MIGGSILGGLGNMMFVIAAIENLAKANNTKAYFPNVKEHLNKVQDDRARIYPNSDVSTLEYLKIFRNFQWNDQGDATSRMFYPFNYKPMEYRDGTVYHGYFQTEKYFTNRDHILHIFEPSDFVLEKIEKYRHLLEGETCAIHVRRGDYSLDQDSKHHTKNMEWYRSAMDIVNADKYIVFSDDVEYAKNNFLGDKFSFVDDKDYIELFLMSMCKHNIISSSSFSWWGAWLNKNDNKKVIAPKKWFGKIDPGYPDFDIVPDSWIKL